MFKNLLKAVVIFIRRLLKSHKSKKQDRHNIYIIKITKCPPGYHNNGFMASHALGHMMYGYTLLVSMNQKVLNKLRKEHDISGHN